MNKGTVLTMMCLLALLVAGCQEGNQMTAWIMGGPDLDNQYNEVIVRGGGQVDPIEAGIEVMAIGLADPYMVYGGYAIGRPLGDNEAYIGYHLLYDEDFNGGIHGPVAGTAIPINDRMDTVVEYQYRSDIRDADLQNPNAQEDHKVYAGVRIDF